MSLVPRLLCAGPERSRICPEFEARLRSPTSDLGNREESRSHSRARIWASRMLLESEATGPNLQGVGMHHWGDGAGDTKIREATKVARRVEIRLDHGVNGRNEPWGCLRSSLGVREVCHEEVSPWNEVVSTRWEPGPYPCPKINAVYARERRFASARTIVQSSGAPAVNPPPPSTPGVYYRGHDGPENVYRATLFDGIMPFQVRAKPRQPTMNSPAAGTGGLGRPTPLRTSRRGGGLNMRDGGRGYATGFLARYHAHRRDITPPQHHSVLG